MYNSFITDIRINPGQPEYGKFIQISGDSNFPAVSVIQVTPAFDGSTNGTNALLSTTNVWPKYAVLTYCINSSDSVGGTITPTSSAGYSTFSNYTSSISLTALSANSSRNYFYIQNLDTNPLFASFGPVANVSTWNTVLQGGTAVRDGKGGSWKDYNYKGMVTVYSAGTPNYIAWDC
jgi:hypothetical protein